MLVRSDGPDGWQFEHQNWNTISCSSTQALVLDASACIGSTVCAVSPALSEYSRPGTGPCNDHITGLPCRANAVFAILAFVQSVLWLSQIADEVVALFQARPCNVTLPTAGWSVLCWSVCL